MARLRAVVNVLAVEDYLVGENDGSWRHEFVNGELFAMAGASERHNVIRLNIAGLLNTMVPEPCRIFDGDMKLHVRDDEDQRFYYPDVFVSCGPNDDAQHSRDDAVLVMEVLSTSTKRADRFEKFEAYKKLPSLAEYVLIEQEFPRVDVFRRQNGWHKETYQPDDIIALDSIAQRLTFDQIYRRVSFINATPTANS